MKIEIEKRFEEVAKYDSMVSKVFPCYEQLPLILLSHIRTLAGSKAHLLDVGCGSGTNLVSFATHQKEWTFVGVDPSDHMIKASQNKINAIGAENRIKLVKGTVDELPKENKFDFVTCILVEHLLSDDGKKFHLIEGIYNRIVSGGWFILFGLHGDFKTVATQKSLNAWLEFVTLQGLPEEVQHNVQHRATVEDSLIPEKRIRELMMEVGFVNIERIFQLQLLGAWCAQKS
jgi:tRNA (cmo5U34)-methyltransferase